jgi:hypothetical protein
MIIDGVIEVDEGVLTFTNESAKELIKELARAIEESEDHKTMFPISIIAKRGNRNSGFVFEIMAPKK